MDLKILELNEDSVRIILKGEDYTFLNMLQHFLLEDENVCIAKYNISHPLTGNPELFVKVKEGSPIGALKKANDKIVEVCNVLLSQIG